VRNKLIDFLIDVAEHPSRLARVLASPEAEMKKAGLSPAARAAIRRRDARAVQRLAGGDRPDDLDQVSAEIVAAPGPLGPEGPSPHPPTPPKPGPQPPIPDPSKPGGRKPKESAAQAGRDGSQRSRSIGSRARRGSLTLVGTGIQLIGHTTPQAVACIKSAEKLLYLVADRATETWLRRLNKTAVSLTDCYAEGKPRRDSYADMVRRIVGFVRAGKAVCVAFYGHPGIFVQPAHDVLRLAREEGFPARMLPAVSAQDCLFADLDVDPAPDGCHGFEATDFLLRNRRFDPSSALILWQVGVIGEISVRKTQPYDTHGLRILAARLRRQYPNDHPVVLYEAARYPMCDPVIERIPLSGLAAARPRPLTTLYVPPKTAAVVDRAMFARLRIGSASRAAVRRRPALPAATSAGSRRALASHRAEPLT